jgi:hypothetical protein
MGSTRLPLLNITNDLGIIFGSLSGLEAEGAGLRIIGSGLFKKRGPMLSMLKIIFQKV